MADSEEKVAQLREVTGIGAEAARQLLLATDGNVTEAVAVHFSGADDPPATDARASGYAASSSSSGGNNNVASTNGNGYVGAREPQAPKLFTGEEAPGLAPLQNGTNGDSTSSAPPQQQQGGWFSSLGRVLTNVSQAALGVASEDFEDWFTTRYGAPCPPFSKEVFGDTVQKALAESKLVLIWFHQEDNAVTEDLCKNIFQNPLISELANSTFLFWAGDVCRFEPGQIARLLGATTFPTIVVLQPLRHGFDHMFCLEWPLGVFAQPLFRLSPTTPGEALNVDQAIAALTTYAQDHNDGVEARNVQRMERDNEMAEARRLREEQDREYEEALLRDQISAIEAAESQAAVGPAETQEVDAKVDEKPEACIESKEIVSPPAEIPTNGSAATPQVAEEESPEVESRRQARAAEILAAAEPEPAGTATAKISLKLPAGTRMQRVFRAEQKLEEVYDWAHCCRPSPKPYAFELWMNFPAKALIDKAATLKDLGLTPSAAVFLKAAED